MLDKIKEFLARFHKPDRVSWAAHWLLALIPCLVLALVWGPYVAGIAALVILLVMTFREGMHLARNGKTKDAILDLLGPLINAILWNLPS